LVDLSFNTYVVQVLSINDEPLVEEVLMDVLMSFKKKDLEHYLLLRWGLAAPPTGRSKHRHDPLVIQSTEETVKMIGGFLNVLVFHAKGSPEDAAKIILEALKGKESPQEAFSAVFPGISDEQGERMFQVIVFLIVHSL